MSADAAGAIVCLAVLGSLAGWPGLLAGAGLGLVLWGLTPTPKRGETDA